MAFPRISAIALALCACTALAQEHAKATLTVEVADQSGARIPGAHITATDQVTSNRFDIKTDASGRAAFYLDQGTYELGVQAEGFQAWKETKVEVKAETHRAVTLPIGRIECGPCVVVDIPEIPLEHQPLTAEIPLIPMQQLFPTDRPLRRKSRWF